MKYRLDWQGKAGILNVIPRAGRQGEEYPEKPGFHPIKVLQEILPFEYMPIVEVGCGYGRLCDAFQPGKYTGLDPNEDAIIKAKIEHVAHSFSVIHHYNYPKSTSKLAYTVAMHIPDDEYPKLVAGLCRTTSRRIVIAEILGSKFRKDRTEKPEGISHATFGREKETHIEEFAKHGWLLFAAHTYPYPRKGDFTFLIFEKENHGNRK